MILITAPLPTRIARWLKLITSPVWFLLWNELFIRMYEDVMTPNRRRRRVPLNAFSIYRLLLIVTGAAVLFKGWEAAAWLCAAQFTFVWTLRDRFRMVWVPLIAYGLAMVM